MKKLLLLATVVEAFSSRRHESEVFYSFGRSVPSDGSFCAMPSLEAM